MDINIGLHSGRILELDGRILTCILKLGIDVGFVYCIFRRSASSIRAYGKDGSWSGWTIMILRVGDLAFQHSEEHSVPSHESWHFTTNSEHSEHSKRIAVELYRVPFHIYRC